MAAPQVAINDFDATARTEQSGHSEVRRRIRSIPLEIVAEHHVTASPRMHRGPSSLRNEEWAEASNNCSFCRWAPSARHMS